MGPARRVRFGFGIVGRRWGIVGRGWGFSRRRPQFGRRVAASATLQQESVQALVTTHEQAVPARREYSWPVLVAFGSLEVRIAETEAEIEAAQRLRYRIFYEEMSAIPTPRMRETDLHRR